MCWWQVVDIQQNSLGSWYQRHTKRCVILEGTMFMKLIWLIYYTSDGGKTCWSKLKNWKKTYLKVIKVVVINHHNIISFLYLIFICFHKFIKPLRFDVKWPMEKNQLYFKCSIKWISFNVLYHIYGSFASIVFVLS